MAEQSPPRWAVHPMRVIFMISRDAPPHLSDRDKWSLLMHDFCAQCLQKDARVVPPLPLRPLSARQLNNNPRGPQNVMSNVIPLLDSFAPSPKDRPDRPSSPNSSHGK